MPTNLDCHGCKPLTILDPCAGGDATHDMRYPSVLKEKLQRGEVSGIKTLDTLDIREDSLAEIKTDYMTWKPACHYDVIITNPPFATAEQIIGKALNDVDPEHGLVIMLLRLNFYGGAKRKDFFQRCPPAAAYVHSKRMSFTDNGKTDSIEYQHAIFTPWMDNRFTALRVI